MLIFSLVNAKKGHVEGTEIVVQIERLTLMLKITKKDDRLSLRTLSRGFETVHMEKHLCRVTGHNSDRDRALH